MIEIHGKQYITVAERVAQAHLELKKLTISTELLPVPNYVVIKATVTTDKGTFTGISAANPSKPIEKMSPFEVAETSAVGRALGFAGYGAVDSIASADEMVKAGATEASEAFDQSSSNMPDVTPTDLGVCKKCGTANKVGKTGSIYCGAMCWLNK
jgi:hypothetical protein